MAAKTFEQWYISLNISVSMEGYRLLQSAWNAATELAEENSSSPNSAMVQLLKRAIFRLDSDKDSKLIREIHEALLQQHQ